ncbi:response regulator [Auraticoccus sp. F435]|uniref:Response regulator n=1 Tax=Auraticoccus cholistanensis TaxID=2656650 RepID=A0A6A9UWX1_9ACTN|nr:response regulator transcription factor [Auraticoccus cholistanensis]MVA76142.1 response regulator [Auraticoccus cholistanensis]
MTGDRTVRVLVADDEPLVRAGVRAVLASDPTIEVVAEAGDGRSAVEAARRHRPDVALLDVQMPELDGLDAGAEIVRLLPGTRTVVLTTFGADDNIRRALATGASGFVLKASDPRELVTAVHAVAEGAAFLSPRVAERVVAQLRRDVGAPRSATVLVDRLTDREREVLGLLSRGLSNAEIGRRLFMVEGTVKGHVSSILVKLGAANRVQAAILGYEAGLTR